MSYAKEVSDQEYKWTDRGTKEQNKVGLETKKEYERRRIAKLKNAPITRDQVKKANEENKKKRGAEEERD